MLSRLAPFRNRPGRKYVVRLIQQIAILGLWLGGWSAPSALSAPPLHSTSTGGTILLLPDLRTLPPSDLDVRILPGNRRVLRLANTIWNGGQGPLELLGEFNPVTRQTSVRQRLYASDTSTRDVFVGEFVWHFGHTHWHFEDFALYELWSLASTGETDRVVSSSDKLSYCLIDTDIVDREHPGFARWGSYYGCGRARQGLSVGWGDTYDSFLDGQSLEVTDLADGVYALTSTANPQRNLLETDYANNTAVVYLRILGNQVKVVTPLKSDGKHCHDQEQC